MTGTPNRLISQRFHADFDAFGGHSESYPTEPKTVRSGMRFDIERQCYERRVSAYADHVLESARLMVMSQDKVPPKERPIALPEPPK